VDQTGEAEAAVRDVDLLAGVVDDLDEASARRAALVQLARRVEVARPEPVRDDAAGLASAGDQRLELRLAHGIDERLDAHVLGRRRPVEQLLDRTGHVGVRPRWVRRGQDGGRAVLGLLDVGLVEGVDGEDRAGDGGGELPAVELGAEPLRPVRADLVRLAVRALRRFARRGDETLALLAGRLRQELLEPEPEPVRLRDHHLVAAFQPGAAESQPELEARALLGSARLLHLHGAVEEAGEVDPHQGGRDETEGRERGVPASDRRLSPDDGRKLTLAGEPFELGARVGDRRERAPRPPEIVDVASRLEGRARFRGGDEERRVGIDPLFERVDGGRMGRVENVEMLRADGPPHDLRSEAGTAHSEQDAIGDLQLQHDGERLHHLLARLARGLVEPAEPAALVSSRPDRRVPRPDALDEFGGVDGRH
jgi:hypothetical protein